MDDYRNVGRHAEDLADGRVLAPGEEASLSAEQARDEHNARLIEEGKLSKVARAKSDKNNDGGDA